MGAVIRRDASMNDVLDDCRETLVRAQARGGVWYAIARERLAPVVALFDRADAQLAQAQHTLLPFSVAVDAMNEDMEALLCRIADDIWSAVAEPEADATLEVLFPGGLAHFAEGDTQDLADRAEVIGEILAAGFHPLLPREKAMAAAAELAEAAESLRYLVEAAKKPSARVRTLVRLRSSAARAAHIELTRVKRLYKAQGFGESEIHSVIPDRPGRTRRLPRIPKVPVDSSPASA